MEVRIRTAEQTNAEADTLDSYVALDDLSKIIATLGSWGVYDQGGYQYGAEHLTGQFVVDDTGAYFLVVMEQDEATS